MKFVRQDTRSVTVAPGREVRNEAMVVYRLTDGPLPFEVRATAEGIQVEGTTPIVQSGGLHELSTVLTYANMQHLSLSMFGTTKDESALIGLVPGLKPVPRVEAVDQLLLPETGPGY
jgi:hypothetical protein